MSDLLKAEQPQQLNELDVVGFFSTVSVDTEDLRDCLIKATSGDDFVVRVREHIESPNTEIIFDRFLYPAGKLGNDYLEQLIEARWIVHLPPFQQPSSQVS